MVLLVDNYDSFTYNLYQYFLVLGQRVSVVRNDELDANEVGLMNPDLIVVSPGPGGPEATGVCPELIERYQGRIPFLGICLGMQTIVHCLGGKVVRAAAPKHGKVEPIRHSGKNLFKGLPSPMKVTRYHSLVVEASTLPAAFSVDAESEAGELMAVSHRSMPLWGLQFHPEAVLTEWGMELLSNALEAAIGWKGGVSCQ